MQRQTFSHPASLVCVAAPSDTSFLVQWENHLLPLQQAGLLTFWSGRQMAPGIDSMTEWVRRLDQADGVILLLSADFFADNACLALMREALHRKSANHTRLIPLLVRPVAWQASELGAFTALPTNGVAITTWESPDEGWRQAVLGLQRLLGLPVHQTASVSKGDTIDRERMLRLLRRTYQTSLSSSLQDIAWIELGLSEHPDAVRNATHLLQRLPDRTERQLPAGTSILSVYDQAEGELLILGTPGAGKSTLLLDLAMGLIARAEAEAAHPLPMIVPLSSWAQHRPSLVSWLVEQLARIYDVPRKLGKHWVEQGQVLPLLDGLDEMEEAARPLCIAAINAYHAEHVTPLVACSRQAEYEAASMPKRLFLQNAVVVQALTRDQADDVIRQGGSALSGLHDALIQNPTMRDLTTTPLMLSVLILAYRGMVISNLPQEPVQLEERIWTDYVERMVREKGAERQGRQDIPVKRYPLEQTCSWLTWLARQMRAHNQTLFDGEVLQVDWLPTSQQQAGRWLGDLFPAIILGAAISVLLILFLSLTGSVAPSALAGAGVIGGFLGWSAHMPPRKSMQRGKRRSWWKHLLQIQGGYFLRAATVALLVAASFGLDFIIIPFLPEWGRDGSWIGGSFLVSTWLLQIVFAQLVQENSQKSPISRRTRFTLRLWTLPVRRAVWTAIILGMGAGVGYGLDYGLDPASGHPGLISVLAAGPSQGLIYGLLYGTTTYLATLFLERQIGTVRLAEQVSWTWRALLRLQHLRTSLVVSLLCGCIFGLDYGLNRGFVDVLFPGLGDGLSDGLKAGLTSGLIYGVCIGLTYWFLLGLYQGINQKHLESQDRRRFNQGLHRTFRNGVLLSLLGAMVITGTSILTVALGYAPDGGLSGGLNNVFMQTLRLSNSWEFFFDGWLILWSAMGGLTLLLHYTLRGLLAGSHTFPLNARRFLDDACARVLLRRVGGGYSFVHRRLLDYFAALSDASETSHL